MIEKTIQKSLVSLPRFKRIIVGISGGPDSVALAYALKQLGYQITLAHLNHDLRGEESDLDAEFVDRLSKDWGLNCVIQKKKIPKKGNLENNARKIRYDFLESVRIEHRADLIAVAHHLDDQIETILLHLLRGAGLKGLRGMEFQNGPVIRPLLTISKADILIYLKERKLEFREDKTNSSLRFQRNQIRHQMIPALQKNNPDFKEGLLIMAQTARQEWKLVHQQASEWIENNVTNYKFSRVAFLELPDAIQSEVLFFMEGYYNIYRSHIEPVKALIKSGETGKRKKCGRHTFELSYDDVFFYRKKVTLSPPKRIKITSSSVQWGRWRLKNQGKETLYVRPWKPGDRFEPNGMEGSKKLQDFFVDRKIPVSERHQTPVIVNNKDEILSVGNFRLAKKGVHLKKCLQVTKIK